MFQTVDEYGIAVGGEIEVQIFFPVRDPQEKTKNHSEFHSAERIIN